MFLIVHRGEHKLSELTEGSLGTFSLSNQCIKLMSCPAAVIWNKAGQANAFPIWASCFGYCKTQPHYHHRQLKGNSRLRTHEQHNRSESRWFFQSYSERSKQSINSSPLKHRCYSHQSRAFVTNPLSSRVHFRTFLLEFICLLWAKWGMCNKKRE